MASNLTTAVIFQLLLPLGGTFHLDLLWQPALVGVLFIAVAIFIWASDNYGRLTASLSMAAFFIVGYPGETPASIEETFKFALSLPLAEISFNVPVPLPPVAVKASGARGAAVGLAGASAIEDEMSGERAVEGLR